MLADVAPGHWATFALQKAMSAIPPIASEKRTSPDVRVVPIAADSGHTRVRPLPSPSVAAYLFDTGNEFARELSAGRAELLAGRMTAIMPSAGVQL